MSMPGDPVSYHQLTAVFNKQLGRWDVTCSTMEVPTDRGGFFLGGDMSRTHVKDALILAHDFFAAARWDGIMAGRTVLQKEMRALLGV